MAKQRTTRAISASALAARFSPSGASSASCTECLTCSQPGRKRPNPSRGIRSRAAISSPKSRRRNCWRIHGPSWPRSRRRATALEVLSIPTPKRASDRAPIRQGPRKAESAGALTRHMPLLTVRGYWMKAQSMRRKLNLQATCRFASSTELGRQPTVIRGKTVVR